MGASPPIGRLPTCICCVFRRIVELLRFIGRRHPQGGPLSILSTPAPTGSVPLHLYLASPMEDIVKGDDDHQGKQNCHTNKINHALAFWFQTLPAAQNLDQYK